MQKLKKILGIVLISSLSGCQSISPKIVKQCSNVNGHCFCRDYKLSRKYIGPQGDFEEAPVEFCEGMIYPLEDYLEMNAWLQEARDKCTRRKKK